MTPQRISLITLGMASPDCLPFTDGTLSLAAPA